MNEIFRLGPALLAGIVLLLPGSAGGQAGASDAAAVADREITAFFADVEAAYRNKRVPDVMAKLHRKFSYIMTYCTDDSFSVVENNIESYRASVGSFFMRDPEVIDFTINILDVERLGERIAVVARITSSVQLDGIFNTCETSSNYNLLRHKGRLLIKDIRGDASCTYRKTGEEPQR